MAGDLGWVDVSELCGQRLEDVCSLAMMDFIMEAGALCPQLPDGEACAWCKMQNPTCPHKKRMEALVSARKWRHAYEELIKEAK